MNTTTKHPNYRINRDGEILAAVKRAKATHAFWMGRTHSVGYTKYPAQKLSPEERRLNDANAISVRTNAADLLRGMRRGWCMHSAPMFRWIEEQHGRRCARRKSGEVSKRRAAKGAA